MTTSGQDNLIENVGMAVRYALTTFKMKTVVVKIMPLMSVMTRGLFRGVWTLAGNILVHWCCPFGAFYSGGEWCYCALLLDPFFPGGSGWGNRDSVRNG